MRPAALFAALWMLAPGFGWGAGPDWIQTFEEQFAGAANTGPDMATWNYDTSTCAWPQNSEMQKYTFDRRENTRLDGNGYLLIEARNDGDCTGYTSGRINTGNKFHSQYGRFSSRLRVPSSNGFWPAFWMIGSNIGSVGWPTCGEMDIMEYRSDMTTRNQGSFHGPNYSAAASYSGYYWSGAPDLAAAYHTYTLEWYPKLARYYVDGNLFYEFRPDMLNGTQTWVFDTHPFFFILNVAVGGVYVGGVNPDASTVWPGQMSVDWVRHEHDRGQLKPWTAPLAVPGRLQAESFDRGGQGVAYQDSTLADLGYTNARGWESVDLEACSDTGGGSNVGWVTAGEWLAYTVNVATRGTYTLTARAANGSGVNGTFHLEEDGVDISGPITVGPSGGWQSWSNVVKTGIHLDEGIHALKVVFDNAAGNFNYFDLALTAADNLCGVPIAPIRVNCGGGAYNDGTDNWAADRAYGGANTWGYVGGTTSAVGTAIANTTADPLFQSDRFGAMEYRFDLPAGRYKVRMLWAETYHTADNKRRFYVGAEGRNLIGDMDLFAYAAGANRAYEETRYVDVSDGTLNLQFYALMDAAKINAIEITDTRVNCGSPTVTLTPTSYAGTPTSTQTRSPSPTLTSTPCTAIYEDFDNGLSGPVSYVDGTGSTLSLASSSAQSSSAPSSLLVNVATAAGSWGAVAGFASSYAPTRNVSGAASLTFWVRTSQAISFFVNLVEGNVLPAPNTANETFASPTVNLAASAAWQPVTLSLGSFTENLYGADCTPNCGTTGNGVLDLAALRMLQLQFNVLAATTGAAVYLDDFKFPGAICAQPSPGVSSSPTPSRTRTVTATATPTRSPSATVTFSLSATLSASPSASATATRSATATGTRTATLSATPSASPTASPSSTPSVTRTLSPSPSVSDSPTLSASPSPSVTGSVTGSPTRTATATASQTSSPSRTASPSLTVSPSLTASPSPPGSLTATPTASPSATASPVFSATPSPSVTLTASPTASPSDTATPTATPSHSPSATATPSATDTSTASPSPSVTATPSASPSSTFSATVTPTATESATATPSASPTATPTASPSPTGTWSVTESPTRTVTPSATLSASGTPTLTVSPSVTETVTSTWSPSVTGSSTSTCTVSPSAVPSATATPTSSRTATPSVSATAVWTLSASPTASATPGPGSPTPTPTRSPAALPPAAAEALEILSLIPFPQPNPRSLMIHLKGGADAIHVKVYSRAFVLLAQLKTGAQAAGWSKIDLQPLLPQIPGGLSFVTVHASRDGARAQTRKTELVRTR